MANGKDYGALLKMEINFEDGFDSPDANEDFDYDNGIVDPRLCDKIKDYEDCPFNTIGRPCINCDVIVFPDELNHILEHIDFIFEED